MIIYLCIQYESNTPMDSKDIIRKPFLYEQDGMYVRTYGRMDKGDIKNGGGIKDYLI